MREEYTKPTLLEEYEAADKISNFLYEKMRDDLIKKGFIETKGIPEEQLSTYSEFYGMWEKSIEVRYGIGSRLYDCSELPTYLARNIFATLLTYVEGERYIPHTSYYPDLHTWAIVAKETEIEKITNNNELEDAIKNGNAIRLDDGISSHIVFYDRGGESHYDIGKFKYAEEFMFFIMDKSRALGIATRNMKEKDIEKLLVEFLKYVRTNLNDLNKDKREVLIKEKICGEDIKRINKKIKQK